jgi:CRP-like cAMP-binding protein
MRRDNLFLASLSEPDRAALMPHLNLVELERNEMLALQGRPVSQATLPLGAVVSVVTLMSDGRSVESRTVGREGGFGLLHALGSRMSYEQVTCQIPGPAYRISLDAISDTARRSPELVRSIVVHAQATLVQSAQQCACNALHGVDGRLCRWLLLTQDRCGEDVLPLTQEHLSIMLGVQRTTVTAAAMNLQSRGLIAYSRGKIRVLDRAGLIKCACECYQATEGAVEQMLETTATAAGWR